MKFERKNHPATGQLCLYIDTDGIDFSDVINAPISVIQEYFYFRISTFDVLKLKTDDTAFDYTFRPVTLLFDSLTPSERKVMAMMYFDIHQLILDKFKTEEDIRRNIDSTIVSIRTYLSQVEAALSLVNKIKKIVRDTIPIPDFTGIGTRPQDSEAMTFTEDMVREVTSIAVICKLMTPIIGTFIEFCKKKLDTNVKELQVVSILKDVLETHFRAITVQLKEYIVQHIKQRYKDNLNSTFTGQTEIYVQESIFAAVLVRRFISINLYQRDCNLMTYIVSCVRSATHSIGGFNSKYSMQEIRTPMESHANDDGNTSMLEAESQKSLTTADIPVLIEVAANRSVHQYLDLYMLDVSHFEEAYRYYSANPFGFNKVAVYLVTLVFGSAVGGASNVNLLTHDNAVKLISILQLLFIQLGVPELADLVTAKRSLSAKETFTTTDTLIAANWRESNEYITMCKRFPYAINGITWNTELTDIVDYILKNYFIINTAPIIHSLKGTPISSNDCLFTYDDALITRIVRVIIMFTSNT